MKSIKKYNLILLIFILLFAGGKTLYAVSDSLVYKIRKVNQGISVFLNGINLNYVFKDNNKGLWIYNLSDKYKYALKSYDDSKWKNVNSDFEIDEIDSTFSGLAWFRPHYRISKEFVGKTFMMDVNHNGASEIFNDNNFLGSFGLVSKSPDSEIRIDPNNEYFTITLNDTLEHVIAVRYSNAKYKQYAKSSYEEEVGFTLRFHEMEDFLSMQQTGEYQRIFFLLSCSPALLNYASLNESNIIKLNSTV